MGNRRAVVFLVFAGLCFALTPLAESQHRWVCVATGIVYVILFVIPIAGVSAIRSGAPIWLRIAALCGLGVSLLAIFFTVYPIIDVPRPLIFAAKIAAVTVIANAIGAAIFMAAGHKRGTD